MTDDRGNCNNPYITAHCYSFSVDILRMVCILYTSAFYIPLHVIYLCVLYTSAFYIPLHVIYLCVLYTSAFYIPLHFIYLCVYIPLHFIYLCASAFYVPVRFIWLGILYTCVCARVWITFFNAGLQLVPKDFM